MMMVLSFVSLRLLSIFLFIFHAQGNSFPSSYDDWLEERGVDYDHFIFLGNSDNVAVHWRIEDDELLHLAVAVVNATGWVGFGIAENGGMPGSDIVIYEADSDEITDTFALDYVEPSVDCIQSWNLVESLVDNENKMILFEVERALDTKDSQDRAILDDSLEFAQANRVIIAWGDTSTVSFHGENRARGSIRFFQTSTSSKSKMPARLNSLDESYSTLNLTAYSFDDSDGSFIPNYTIPDTNDTIYHNFAYDLNALSSLGFPVDTEHHIVGFRFLEYAPSIEYVHHALLLAIKLDETGEEAEQQDLLFTWGPGVQDIVLPDDVGFLFSSDLYDLLVIAAHYDNRNYDSNVVDMSGIQIFYTETLRKYNMGVFQLGDGSTQLDTKSATLGTLKSDEAAQWEFTCPSECIEEYLNENDVTEVTVFLNGLHMHEIGVVMKTELIDSCGKVIHTSEVDYYDFAISGAFTPVQNPYKVRAGDTFRTTCFYKSDQDIPFGQGSLDEMCIDFLYYYPKVLPSHCGASGEGACFTSPKRVKTPDKCMNRKFGTDPYFFCPLFGSGEKKTQSDNIFGSGRSLQFSQLFELSQFQCCPEPE